MPQLVERLPREEVTALGEKTVNQKVFTKERIDPWRSGLSMERYHQNLDMTDEIVLFVWRRPKVCCLCLVTTSENVSVQFACVLRFKSA